MIVVNFFGGPCAGKSTAAAYLFSVLKAEGYSVELITEFAKDLTWEGRHLALETQAYVFGKQLFKMKRCEDKVDILITDSPLLLSCFYNNDPLLGDEFNEIVLRNFNAYNNINIFLPPRKEYKTEGRNQTKEEAEEISNEIFDFLTKKNIGVAFCSDMDEIVYSVKNRLNTKKETPELPQEKIEEICEKVSKFTVDFIKDYVNNDLRKIVAETLDEVIDEELFNSQKSLKERFIS
jgi:hypothetical protein